MVIGYYAKWLSAQPAGVGMYFLNLLKALSERETDDEYHLFTGPHGVPASLSHLPQHRYAMPLSLLEPLWRRCGLFPLDTLVRGLDIFHSPMWYMPRMRSTPCVMTVHDLAFLIVPEIYDASRRRLWTDTSYLDRTDFVIADSEATRQDLLQHTSVKPKQVRTVHLGVDHGVYFRPTQEELEAFAARARPPEHFFLFVGTLEPRKNLVRLLRAFERFHETVDRSYHLLLAGGRGWLYEDILAAHRSLGCRDNVRFLGYLSAEDTRGYMAACTAFVYPSLYEGFGLPNLEAMACGAPVITSRAGAIPEVVGDAAAFVDPCSVDTIVSAMRDVAAEHSLRERLVAAGLRRSAEFTWKRCAEETLACYREASRTGA
jgi:glycosyltransferase involved in cell wall biosynthesis